MQLPPTTLLVMGIQGAGKGTQADLLMDRHGYSFISMGDLLRAEKEKDTERGRLVKGLVEAGELVPDDVSTPLLLDAVRDLDPEARLIIDGHPRTLVQADLLLDGLQEVGRSEVTALFLSITEEEGMKRLLERGRQDDTEEKIRKRFQWSRDSLMPVVDRFRSEGRLVELDGGGTIDDVFTELESALDLG
ncbi:MAG: nucleoside monophosphate kinase [Candidatus Doudnabacteria bacterium]|nr:nucleoside monophosphate kinase [Candidatus Doudnabacteria bacterium]MCA9387421.1 nucleoside monophosphate kinase [Candidatus Andersenbacteria bacterium]